MTVKSLVLLLALSALLIFAGCGGSGDDDSSGGGGSDDASADDTAADDTADDTAGDDTVSTEQALIKDLQPALVQALAADYSGLPYSPLDDLIGKVSLHGGDAEWDYIVRVDTNAPVMYSFQGKATIRGHLHKQYLYAWFYPERPRAKTISDYSGYLMTWWDAGAIDGKVVRVTLDADGKTPLLIEVMRNCGCGWQLYVNKKVDDAARQEFEQAGETYPGLAKADAPSDVQYVFIMAEDVADATGPITVVDDFGWTVSSHNILGAFTSYEQWLASDLKPGWGALYWPQDRAGSVTPAMPIVQAAPLLDYEPLYHLTAPGSAAEVGIFDEFGYIWNAYGYYHKWMHDNSDATEFPGTPRDPAAFEVVHETIPFWTQEALYDTFIYLPESIFGPKIE